MRPTLQPRRTRSTLTARRRRYRLWLRLRFWGGDNAEASPRVSICDGRPGWAAQAWDIQCAQPLVIFGDNRPGPGMSTDVRVALDQDGKGWQVWHDLADGRVISRADQYAVNDLRNPAVAVGQLKKDTAWFGLLNGRAYC